MALDGLMDRREFLSKTVAATALTVAARNAAAAQVVRGLPDVVVIGAGVFGVWTALLLRERGHRVTLLDAYGPGNSRSASGDESRHIRAGYEANGLYSDWAMKSMALWKEREIEFKRRMLYPAARLQMAKNLTPDLAAQKTVFDKLKIPYEVLPQQELQTRWPQINFEDVGIAFYETETSSAVLKARENCMLLAEMFEKKGGEFKIAHAMPSASSGRTLNAVGIGNGETVSAGMFVFATGPWLRKTFPQLLARKISTPRRELYYWGVPAGDTRFKWPNLPTWSDGVLGNYGFPNFDRGVKVAPPGAGVFQQDPDDAERVPSGYLMRQAREWVAQRFPALKDIPILETRVCQVEQTGNSDFLIDHHPDWDNVWIAGGGSGHGYKHGPMIGKYVADRVEGNLGDPELAKKFALAGRADAQF
jgi:glycine/D-amino acid oxidase-like deaminating enzyme